MGRKRIGLLFKFDEQWTGGLYYLYNVINCFKYLPSAKQPHLVIFYYQPQVIEEVKKIEYPFVTFLPIEKIPTLKDRVLNKISLTLLRKPYRQIFSYAGNVVDYLFPVITFGDSKLEGLKYLKIVFWITDFQHKHLPHFFSGEEVKSRDTNFELISRYAGNLVLSSEDARRDFQHFFPDHRVKLSVIPFASVLPKYDHLLMADLRLKYKLESSNYFISPNQFWIHKNHMVILKAACLLRERNVDFQVIFTGREDDYRNPHYTHDLKEFVRQEKLEKHVKFLGFIERSDQLKLMKEAVAVIQPSLFEGWSTVVEDTKSVNNSLILSDLKVHREQCGALASYFDPRDEVRLAEVMSTHLRSERHPPFGDYKLAITDFASKLLQI